MCVANVRIVKDFYTTETIKMPFVPSVGMVIVHDREYAVQFVEYHVNSNTFYVYCE